MSPVMVVALWQLISPASFAYIPLHFPRQTTDVLSLVITPADLKPVLFFFLRKQNKINKKINRRADVLKLEITSLDRGKKQNKNKSIPLFLYIFKCQKVSSLVVVI